MVKLVFSNFISSFLFQLLITISCVIAQLLFNADKLVVLSHSEDRLLFYVSVSHSLLSGICSASSLGLVPARVCLLLRLCQNNYIGLAQLFPE